MKKIALLVICLVVSAVSVNGKEKKETNNSMEPLVVEQLVQQAKKNSNWKMEFITGEYEQIVFMNISTKTNPNNEIGEEVHTFDQAILVVKGQGNAVLNKKTYPVKEGDMIFVPAGMSHNLINSDAKGELKIISFYSATDMPNNAVYKKQSDEPRP